MVSKVLRMSEASAFKCWDRIYLTKILLLSLTLTLTIDRNSLESPPILSTQLE